jgi:hypothetical protein
MRRLTCLALLVAAAVAVAGSAQATPSPTNPGLAHALGLVPTLHAAYRPTYGYGQLRYHGGPVMHTNTVYAIYWQPSNWSTQMASGYSALINRFFTDVAADSGKTTNVYDAATQYSDGSGSVAYRSTFAGSTTVADPLPASGCSDSATEVCLTDAQLQSEIQSVVARNGWPVNSQTEYFLFTAPGVGSCAGSSCAFTDYCAYHSWIGGGSTALVYANQPYADGVSGCDAGYHPNGGQGDATINVVSHEHNESITDEQGNAWYDLFGYEDGDKCAWSWGAITGAGSAGYNQTIDGHHYIAQLEYSNASRGCVQSGL